MSVPRLSKLFWGFNLSMGVYGAHRGYRSQRETLRKDGDYTYLYTDPRPLTGDKITSAFVNGCFYSLPIFNLLMVHKLVNRLEIQKRGLKKDDYQENYSESFVGYCYDTI